MISTIQIDLELWEAWIEFDHLSEGFGKLYIMGEIFTPKSKSKPRLIKRNCTEKGKLALTLLTEESMEKGKLTEVVYDETIHELGQYQCIHIYRDDELIAEIREIEVLI